MHEYEKTDAPELLEPITVGGRVYEHRIVIQRKYALNRATFFANIRLGLPYETADDEIYINEDDFHRFFRGEIGRRKEYHV